MLISRSQPGCDIVNFRDSQVRFTRYTMLVNCEPDIYSNMIFTEFCAAATNITNACQYSTSFFSLVSVYVVD